MKQVRLMQGNEACAEGALAAGVRFFAGYPITPSTELAEFFAARLPRCGGTFIQMEDEIAGMAAICGASLTGKKSLTATSGPGFSLKQELIGYAAMAEIPVVVVNVQRSGPSTGQPTSPAQGDVMQARWGTHGDRGVIALCPASVREAFDVGFMAVNYAEQFRTPVIVLLDEVIGHMREKIVLPAAEELTIVNRRLPQHGQQNYLPYQPDDTGVPAPANFGDGYRYHVTGLVHDYSGFPSASPQITQEIIDRLHTKVASQKHQITHYTKYMLDDADIAVVAYGATARTALAAVEKCRGMNIKAGLLKLTTIWPFADDVIAQLADTVKTILVPEMNYGQLVGEIDRAAKGKVPVITLPKYNTEIFTPDEICSVIIRSSQEVR
jgi:2-oxoglutarate/2-oxoacid ferredoxin oxidoreductase subunit alpha